MHKVRCSKLGFWNNYVDLCTKNGKTPNGAAEEIGISSGSITAWKKGRVPRPQNQKQIADYFGVTVDYLLNAEKENPTAQGDGVDTITEKEVRMLKWFRSLPEEKRRAILISQDAPKDLLD